MTRPVWISHKINKTKAINNNLNFLKLNKQQIILVIMFAKYIIENKLKASICFLSSMIPVITKAKFIIILKMIDCFL